MYLRCLDGLATSFKYVFVLGIREVVHTMFVLMLQHNIFHICIQKFDLHGMYQVDCIVWYDRVRYLPYLLNSPQPTFNIYYDTIP
jgi:hypothetical protein